MLYIQDQDGTYQPAPKDVVFNEAHRLSGHLLRRGVIIRSSVAAKAVIQLRLNAYECEVFACLFLDSRSSPGSGQRGPAAECRRGRPRP